MAIHLQPRSIGLHTPRNGSSRHSSNAATILYTTVVRLRLNAARDKLNASWLNAVYYWMSNQETNTRRTGLTFTGTMACSPISSYVNQGLDTIRSRLYVKSILAHCRSKFDGSLAERITWHQDFALKLRCNGLMSWDSHISRLFPVFNHHLFDLILDSCLKGGNTPRALCRVTFPFEISWTFPTNQAIDKLCTRRRSFVMIMSRDSRRHDVISATLII